MVRGVLHQNSMNWKISFGAINSSCQWSTERFGPPDTWKGNGGSFGELSHPWPSRTQVILTRHASQYEGDLHGVPLHPAE